MYSYCRGEYLYILDMYSYCRGEYLYILNMYSYCRDISILFFPLLIKSLQCEGLCSLLRRVPDTSII